MFAHALDWPKGGFIGVDMFFALSGFLITTILLEEWRSLGSVSLRDFYLRRYYRLFPALAVLLVVYVLYVLVFMNGGMVFLRLRGALFGITYTANWAQALQVRFPDREIGYLWTLGIEEQFYLLWPALLILMLKRGFGLRGIRWALLGMIVAVVAWRNLLIAQGVDNLRTYVGTDVRFDELLVGCFAATLFVARDGRKRAPAWLMPVTLIAGAFVAYRTFVRNPWTFWTVRITLTFVAIATTVVIYSCVTNAFPLLKRALSMRWLVFVGVISYSLYLWHVQANIWMEDLAELTGWRLAAAEIPLGVALACASYFFVERPFVRRRKAHERLIATKADVEEDMVSTSRYPSAKMESDAA